MLAPTAAVAMTIESGGQVGVGDTTPDYGLDVVGDINSDDCFREAGVQIAGTCASDSRLKHNINSINGSLSRIMQLRPVEYEWNENVAELGGTLRYVPGRQVGLIAQEMQLVFPNLVKEKNGYLSVSYNLELQMAAINAIQELGLNFDLFNASTTASLSLLSQAMQDQNLKIESMQADITTLMNSASTTAFALAQGFASATVRMDSFDSKLLTLDSRLSTLEMNFSDFVASSSALTLTASTTENLARTVLAEMGASIVDGITHFKQLAVESLSVFALTIGQPDKPTGITLYDQITGAPFCMKIVNGQPVTTAGDCSNLTASGGTPQNAVATPTTTDTTASSTPATIDTTASGGTPPSAVATASTTPAIDTTTNTASSTPTVDTTTITTTTASTTTDASSTPTTI